MIYNPTAQHQLIKRAVLNPDDTKMRVELRLFALVVRLGGWLGRKRDPIGPSILMRGILQLIAIFDTLESHRSLIEEALQHPEILAEMFGIALNDN